MQNTKMVKPLNNAPPQAVPSKSNVEKNALTPSKEEFPDSTPQKPKPIYDAKAQIARRAEHSFMGTAQAAKLHAELQRVQGGNMSIPRMKWGTDVKNSNPVPTPYPNIANANKKDESKK